MDCRSDKIYSTKIKEVLGRGSSPPKLSEQNIKVNEQGEESPEKLFQKDEYKESKSIETTKELSVNDYKYFITLLIHQIVNGYPLNPLIKDVIKQLIAKKDYIRPVLQLAKKRKIW